MYTNTIESHLVTLSNTEIGETGTGVLLASDHNSDYYFLLTARHNLFKEYNAQTFKEVDPNALEINYQGKELIQTEFLEVHFFPEGNNEFYDFALMIFRVKNRSDIVGLKNLAPIRIYNSDHDREIRNDSGSFEAAGYTDNGSNDFVQKYTGLSLRLVNPSDENVTEVLRNFDGQALHSLTEADPNSFFNGMSGGGVFHQEKNNELQLKSIIFQYFNGNFSCVRLDVLSDQINLKISLYEKSKLNSIQIDNQITAGDESIEIDKITNFAKTKEKVIKKLENSKTLSDYKLPEHYLSSTVSKQDIQAIAKDLRKAKYDLRKKTDSLSYLFALLALKSEENNDRRLTTNYFRDAIELNPEHALTLIVEKANRKEQISVAAANSASSLEMKYTKLLSMFPDSDHPGKRDAVRQAINDTLLISDEDEDKAQTLQQFKHHLIETYEGDDTTKSYRKYQELGDYLFSLKQPNEPLCPLAFKHHTLALKIVERSPKTTDTFEFFHKESKRYEINYNDEFKEKNEILVQEALKKAEAITRKEEDPKTTELIRRVKAEAEASDEIRTNKAEDLKLNQSNQVKSTEESRRLPIAISATLLAAFLLGILYFVLLALGYIIPPPS